MGAVTMLTLDYIMSRSVHLPETVFPLGADYRYVSDDIKKVNRRYSLNIDNLLAATPIVWTHLPEYHIGQFLVTNAEYRVFVASGPKKTEPINYNSPQLWRDVWDTLYRVVSANIHYKTVSEQVQVQEQNYAGCQSFVEAYIESLKYEIQRVVDRTEGHVTFKDPESLERLFAFVKFKLRGVIAGEEDELFGFWEEISNPYEKTDEFVADLNDVARAARRGYMEVADSRTRAALKAGVQTVEPLLFLKRFSAACRGCDLEAPIPLHKVLYPRNWAAPSGGGGGIAPTMVPWEQRPVTCITFYEALAFCIWLTRLHNTQEKGIIVTLPNEAEYERAATWPPEPLNGTKMILDPKKKDILPWLNRSNHDFHHFFGQEGINLYSKDRWNDVMEETAREVNGKKIYQLVGFGHQWTVERYNPSDHRYTRLRLPMYPRFTRVACYDTNGNKLDVVDYNPYQNQNEWLFVVRGCAEILGGPGLATRRFALPPLRGYPDVGFRWVLKPV